MYIYIYTALHFHRVLSEHANGGAVCMHIKHTRFTLLLLTAFKSTKKLCL